MQKFKPLLIELIWLAVILNATVLVTIFIFGWTFLSNHFDIRLHETYFTISSWKIVLPLFVLFAFVIYSIKEIRHHFNRRASNIIILLAGGILILLIATINKQVIITEMIYFGDVAIYRPLSAFNEAQLKTAISPAVHVVSNSLTVIQCLVTTGMLYVAFKMGHEKAAALNNPQRNGVAAGSHNRPKPQPVATKQKSGDKLTS
jgi:hypothetical protein